MPYEIQDMTEAEAQAGMQELMDQLDRLAEQEAQQKEAE